MFTKVLNHKSDTLFKSSANRHELDFGVRQCSVVPLVPGSTECLVSTSPVLNEWEVWNAEVVPIVLSFSKFLETR